MRLCASLLPLAFAVPALGQEQIAGEFRTTTLRFQPGSAAADGYEHGTMEVRYRFLSCARSLYVVYSPQGSSIQAGSSYWYRGERVTVPGGIAPPRYSNSMGIDGIAFQNNARVGTFGDGAAIVNSTAFGCWSGNAKPVGPLPEHLRRASTDQVSAYLNTLRATIGTPATLRSGAVVDAILTERREAERQRQEEARRRAEAERLERERQTREREQREREERERLERERAQREREAEQRGAQAQAQADQRRAEEARERLALERSAQAGRNAAQAAQPAIELWVRAEHYFGQRNYAAARPLYQQIVQGPPAWDPVKQNARMRLTELDREELPVAIAAGAVLVAEAVGTVVEGLDDYDGFLMGVNYQTSGFADDPGLIGLSLGLYLPEDLPITAYFDLGVGIADFFLNETLEIKDGLGLSFTVGVASHRTSLDLAGLWMPHVGYRFMSYATNKYDDTHHLIAGVMRMGEKSFTRFDVVLGGVPQFGIGFGFKFGNIFD